MGEEFVSKVINDCGYRRKLTDDAIVGLRIITSSTNSPTVNLNIVGEKYIRKIHFYRGEIR